MSQPVTDQQIQQVLDYANKVLADYWTANNITHCAPSTVTAEKAKRYARLVITQDAGNGSRCAYGFLDLTNGNLLKANSWKAPDTKLVRGNVHANDLKCCGWCRIA